VQFNHNYVSFKTTVQPTTAMAASLPPKEGKLFKLTVKSHKTKQYKGDIKAADAILKNSRTLERLYQ
jgi:hypothetical protein